MMSLPSYVKGVVADQRNPQLVRVYIGDDVYTIDALRAVQLGLREGLLLDDHGLDAIKHEAAVTDAKERALRILGQRPYTEAEIGAKLRGYGFDADCITAVLAWLRDVGYVDDRRYAERWVEQRAEGRGYGPLRLRHELAQKGVARELIDEALGRLDEAQLEEIAYRLASDRWRKVGADASDKVRRQIYGYLERRGFSAGIIRRVLRRLFGAFPA